MKIFILIIALVSTLGCRGGFSINGDDDGMFANGPLPTNDDDKTKTPEGGVEVLPGEDVSPNKLTRIRQNEYINIARYALGDVEINTAVLPSDHRIGQFSSNADQFVTQTDLDLYWQSAEFIAGQLSVDAFCDSGLDDVACGESLVENVGRDLFRRPPSEETKEAHRTLIDALLADGANRQAMFETIVAALLQSPNFLYRVERVADLESTEPQSIEGYAIADRLAAFLWRGEPDAELMAAAENGDLSDRDAIESHVRRMLGDSRASDTIRDFHLDWLEVSRLDDVAIDTQKFPAFDQTRDSLMEEYTRFVELTVRDRGYQDLIAADYVLMNTQLAAFYGTQPPANDWDEVANVPNRGGIMTMGAVLAVHGEDTYTQSLFRGLFVREQVLCHKLPGRPEDVDQGLAAQEETLPPDPSDRDRLEHLTNQNDCAFCHQMMNPIGYGFGGYNAIGMWQDVDSTGHELDLGFTLQGNGSEIYASDIDGVYSDAIDLADALADSETVRQCYAKQWFRFGTGRMETEADAQTLASMSGTLASTDDVEELIVELATSSAFLLRRLE